MLRHGRYDHVPITSRPSFSWPGGKRLAVYGALGVGCYEFGEGMVENLVPGGRRRTTSWTRRGATMATASAHGG